MSAASPDLRLQPCFFGPDDSLFGCHHAPEGEDRHHGVVVCPPFGHEALQFHRALAQLAGHLARAGCPVLRFDPYGCGDSAGDGTEGRLARWVEDIASAIEALRARAPGLRRVSLVGLRLGATLALRCAAERTDVDGLALWDPILDGRAYLEQLDRLHAGVLARAHVLPTAAESSGARDQRLGFPLSAEFVADLLSLRLTDAPLSVRKALVLRSHPQADTAPLVELLRVGGARVTTHQSLQPELWRWEEDFGRQLVPLPLLRRLVEGLVEDVVA